MLGYRAAVSSAAVVLALGAVLAAGARSQEAPRPGHRIIRGTVTDTLGVPLPLAYVRLAGAPSAVLCDDSGRFRLPDLAAGPNVIEVRRLGYVPGEFTVEVLADSTVGLVIQLVQLATVLRPVTVAAERLSLSLVEHGFYERLRQRRIGLGSGTFITPEEIEASHPPQVTHLLFDRQGLRMAYKGNMAIPWDVIGECVLNVYVDGIEIRDLYGDWSGQRIGHDFGQVGKYARRGKGAIGIDAFIRPSSVKAIEIYPSGPGTPMQFQGFNSCGAIVIWTKVD